MNLLDHDDFSWLVYADWLEERGDNLSEHIRFQVEEDLDAWNYECQFNNGVIVGGGVNIMGDVFDSTDVGGVGFGSVVGGGTFGVGGVGFGSVIGGLTNSVGGDLELQIVLAGT